MAGFRASNSSLLHAITGHDAKENTRAQVGMYPEWCAQLHSTVLSHCN